MKKMASFVGLSIFFILVSVDASAAECQRGFAKSTSGSQSHDEISNIHQAACAESEAFHIPPAVPLFLSAIAGLGIVAFRGKRGRGARGGSR